MRKEILFPSPDENIFTEGIDYFTLGSESLWGKGDSLTVSLLQNVDVSGNWLDLGAGDGRYVNLIIDRVDKLLAVDIDPSALKKLWHRTTEKHRIHLHPLISNIIYDLPLKSNYFDGVICTGTLHYFSEDIIRKTVMEIDRVLKVGGKIVIDFAYGIHRTSPNGMERYRSGASKYDCFPFGILFQDFLEKYRLIMQGSSFDDDITSTHGYVLSGKYIVLYAEKLCN